MWSSDSEEEDYSSEYSADDEFENFSDDESGFILSEDDETTAGSESEPEFSSQLWEEGEKYNDRQEKLLDALKESFGRGDMRLAKKILVQIDSDTLESAIDDLHELFWEQDDPDLYPLFQNNEILAFDKDTLLETAIENNSPVLFIYFLNELDAEQEKLLELLFEYEAVNFCLPILEYYFANFSEEKDFANEISKLPMLIDFDARKSTIQQIITSLVYEHQRHAWDSLPCIIRREMLSLFDTKHKFEDWEPENFIQFLNKKETKHKTFFGVDLSDDSDSDDEKKLQRQDLVTRHKKLNHSIALARKAETHKTKKKLSDFSDGINEVHDLEEELEADEELELINDKEKKQRWKKIKKKYDHLAKITYDLPGRAKLNNYFDLSLQAKKDLTTLNQEFSKAAAKGKIPELLAKLPTKFVVMQARGVTHSTSAWNAPGRRFHRQWNEKNLPLFSPAAYRAAGVDFNNEASRQALSTQAIPTLETLQKKADKIKLFLLKLRNIQSLRYKNKTYNTPGDALQETYTNDYDNYAQLLNQFGFNKPGNPFISTGDRPYHSLRYAYGIKPYAGHEHERLRPRWQKSGKAERNKSGKTYLSIHPLTDYDANGPLSVTSMVWQGLIFVDNQIIAERETTFPSFLPANRVISQHIAKYPSFHRPYKNIYQIKYGFDRELYELFQSAILSTAPHTNEHRAVKKLLGDWLCVYHETRLIDEALAYTKQNNIILVYRQPNGTFDFTLAPDSPFRNGQAEAVRTRVKNLQEQRRSSNAHFTTPAAVKKPIQDSLKEDKTVHELYQLADLCLEDADNIVPPLPKKSSIAGSAKKRLFDPAEEITEPMAKLIIDDKSKQNQNTTPTNNNSSVFPTATKKTESPAGNRFTLFNENKEKQALKIVSEPKHKTSPNSKDSLRVGLV